MEIVKKYICPTIKRHFNEKVKKYKRMTMLVGISEIRDLLRKLEKNLVCNKTYTSMIQVYFDESCDLLLLNND